MINRMIIFLLLIALLFALYKYQENILDSFSPEKKKMSRTKLKKTQNKEDVNIDNVSQISIGSFDDLESFGDSAYKAASILESLDSDPFSLGESDGSTKEDNEDFFLNLEGQKSS